MTRLRLLGVLIVLAAGAQTAEAQKRWLALTLGLSFPAGETMDFTPDATLASFRVDARQRVAERLTLGLSWSFTELSDEVDEILDFRQLGFPDFDNIAGNVSGNQFRMVNTVPLLVTAHYYFTDPTRAVVPYIGGGGGATYNQRRLNIGLQEFQDDSWSVALIPEAGLLWWTSEWVAVTADVRYGFGFFGGFDVSYWNIDFGAAWRF